MFPYVETPFGWIWAHAYGFEKGRSTFVVETTPEAWRGLQFDRLGREATLRALERIFSEALDGRSLQARASARDAAPWATFLNVDNRHWSVGNLVLAGDAAHTTHFSIGSGTMLAMQDAMALSAALERFDSCERAVAEYQAVRQRQVRAVQRDATRSARWFEQVSRYAGRPDPTFAGLMDDRRSPVMGRLPVNAYLGLRGAADRVPGVATPLRRLVSCF